MSGFVYIWTNKISEAKMGKKLSEEHRKKIIQGMTGVVRKKPHLNEVTK